MCHEVFSFVQFVEANLMWSVETNVETQCFMLILNFVFSFNWLAVDSIQTIEDYGLHTKSSKLSKFNIA